MLRRRLVGHGDALLLVALGGILGANLRYVLDVAAGGALAVTLVVNAVGSFGLGLLLFDARADDLLSKRFRYVFGTGFLASFTTYSTFVADIAVTAPALAVTYLVASYAMGFAGVLASREIVAMRSETALAPPTSGDD
jgi:CrcB protein